MDRYNIHSYGDNAELRKDNNGELIYYSEMQKIIESLNDEIANINVRIKESDVHNNQSYVLYQRMRLEGFEAAVKIVKGLAPNGV